MSKANPPDLQTVLDALQDSVARRFIELLEEPQTAKTLSEESDIPLSTTYRKLDLLKDAGLVSERSIIETNGANPSQFTINFDAIEVYFKEDHSVSMTIHESMHSPTTTYQ